jgi:phosphatidylinositol alpha-mannosyltransferase
VVASDLDAFRRVLDDGRAGRLVRAGEPSALSSAVVALLRDDDAREALVATAHEVALRYDWSRIADRILQVYETVVVGADPVFVSD